MATLEAEPACPGAGARRSGHVRPRHGLVAGGAVTGFGVLAAVDPSRHGVGVPCPLRLLTGLDCPLCGATRATYALVHGDVLRALDHNALFVLALPVVCLLVLLWLVRGRLPSWLATDGARWSFVAVTVAFGVVRNLPIDALDVLGSAAGRQ